MATYLLLPHLIHVGSWHLVLSSFLATSNPGSDKHELCHTRNGSCMVTGPVTLTLISMATCHPNEWGSPFRLDQSRDQESNKPCSEP